MKKNMGNIDRALRSLLALVFIMLYYLEVLTGTLGVVLIVLSIIFY